MNRTIALFTGMFIACMNCTGQNPRWQWAQSGRGENTGYCETWCAATDFGNNVLIGGFFGGSAYYFGNDALLCNCNRDVEGQAFFVAKYDSNGNFLWARVPQVTQASEQSTATAVSTGPDNRVYLTGYFLDSIIIGSLALYNPNTFFEIFTICFDSAGTALWAKALYARNGCEQLGISVDASGNLYAAGVFNDTLVFGPSTLISNGGYPTSFIAKYDSAGNELWAKGASNFNSADAIACTDVGPVITGSFQGDSMRFGNTTLNGFNSNATRSIYTIKFDLSGNVIWARASKGNDYALSNGIAVDRQENIYITGAFSGDSITFAPYTIYSALPGGFANTLFIVKYNAGGQVQWVKGSKLNLTVYGYGIAADEFENVYVCGSMDTGALGIDSTILQTPPGAIDPMFVLSMDSNGILLCAEILASGGDDQSAICVDRTGNAIVAGDYEVNPFHIGDSVFTLSCEEDGFIAKFACGNLGCAPPPVSITINGDTLIANNGAAFQWYLNGNPLPGATTNRLIYTQGGDYTVRVSDSIGCSSISNPVTLGIADLTADAINVFPNPATGAWHVSVAAGLIGSASEVYDNQGRIVYQSKITSAQSEIELPLPGGVYFLKIASPQGMIVKKLVKL